MACDNYMFANNDDVIRHLSTSIICGQRVVQGVTLDFGVHSHFSQDYPDDPETEQDGPNLSMHPVYGGYEGFDPLGDVEEPILPHKIYTIHFHLNLNLTWHAGFWVGRYRKRKLMPLFTSNIYRQRIFHPLSIHPRICELGSKHYLRFLDGITKRSRDGLDVVKHLIANPVFAPCMDFWPYQEYKGPDS
ncbi:hypothetical protein EV424DRAFT_1346555 [Suillus variegatus]|nr:hypothetical protein EV424DRAFT_1346555 [Suillus variegatus]